MKQISVHHHFTRERVVNGEVMLEWIPTERMAADMLMKGDRSRVYSVYPLDQ
jgi:hypothetical protein